MALVALRLSLLIYISRSTIMKSVSLTPSNPNINGATASCTHNDCNIIHNAWTIDTTGYLQIDLDNSWSFHPHKESIISFTFYSSTLLPSQHIDPLFFFSVNNAQYITHYRLFDYKSETLIYPPTCHASNNPSDLKPCILETICKDNPYTDILPHNPNIISFPITITLINNPITQQSSTALSWNGWSQSCSYHQSFDTNHGLQLYIAANDIGYSITFTQFDIDYEYQSNNPIINPNRSSFIIDDMILSNSNEDATELPLMFIIIILSAFVIVCCCCLCITFAVYKLRRTPSDAEEEEEEESTMIQIGVLESEEFKKQRDMDRAVVASWLENDVGLPQYFSLFIKHGYESIKFVSGIEEKTELKKMGILILGHQTLIWAQIKKLKMTQMNTMSTNAVATNTFEYNDVASISRVAVQQKEPPRKYKQSDSDLYGELPPSFVIRQDKRDSDLWGEQQNDLPLSKQNSRPLGAVKQNSVFGNRMGLVREDHVDDEPKSFQSEQLYGSIHKNAPLYKKASNPFAINIKKQYSVDGSFNTHGFIGE